MNTRDLLLHQAEYTLWANMRYVERLALVPPDLLDRHVPSSFPSLRATVLHIRDAEHVWWCRLTGTPTRWPAEISIEIDTLPLYTAKLRDLLYATNDADLRDMLSYADLKGNTRRQPAWQMYLHCFNHGTQHRGQLITMMRTLGINGIPANDMVVYQRSLVKP
jgi:uncharacterized damage-inducible protein DinB